MRRAWITVACVGALAAAAVADEAPPPPWIAAEARLGAAWVTGGALRDAEAARGTQVGFGRDLDLDAPAPAGTIALHARLGGAWRASAELTWTSFEGRAVQGGGSVFNPTPPTLTFDGASFTGQTLESELDVLLGAVGIWRRCARLDDATLELGLGVHGLAADLTVGTPGGPEADERSVAATPWIGGVLEAPLARWCDAELGGRLGFLWGGDSVRYHVHALVELWAGVAVPLGPLRLGARVDYRLIDTHERARRRDEMLDLSLVMASLSVGMRF